MLHNTRLPLSTTIDPHDPFVRLFTDRRAAKRWLLALFIASALAAVAVIASTVPDEFTPAAVKFEGWLTGGYGKMAAFLAVGIGVVIAAFTKSIFPAATGIGIAVIIAITLGVINASFTAVI